MRPYRAYSERAKRARDTAADILKLQLQRRRSTGDARRTWDAPRLAIDNAGRAPTPRITAGKKLHQCPPTTTIPRTRTATSRSRRARAEPASAAPPRKSHARERRYKPRRRKVIPFLEKLVQLLQEEPDVIRWTREGTIVIPDPAKLEPKLPSYFRHQHYSSFQF